MWCWEGHLGRVRRCRVVCNQIVCVGYPKCFPEAGAKQRINPFQLMPLPRNISASFCFSKLGEWQWIGKGLYCKSMISQQGVIICTRPFCSRLFPWLQKYRPSPTTHHHLPRSCQDSAMWASWTNFFLPFTPSSNSAALQHCRHSLRAPGSDKLLLCEAGQEENDSLQRGRVIKILKEKAEVGDFVRAWE